MKFGKMVSVIVLMIIGNFFWDVYCKYNKIFIVLIGDILYFRL